MTETTIIDAVAPPRRPVPASGRIALKRTPQPRGGRFKLIGADAARLVLPAILLLAWQGACSFGLVGPRTLESPVAVVQALVELATSGVLWESLVASFKRAAAGVLLGGGFGLVLGIASGLSRASERTYDALLQMLRMVPFLAVIPLFVIWFGVDEEPKILLIALACIFPVYLNTFSGVRNVDPKIIEAATVFGMSRSAIATRIVAPLALPSIMVGIRYAMGVALLSLVAAEQVNATSGIGYLALNPRASLRTDIILGVVLLYSVLGLAVDFLIRTVQSRLLPWHRTVLEKAR